MALDKTQAVADIRRLALFLQGITAIGDDLEALGSLENAAAEAQARLTATTSQEAAARAAAETATAALTDLQTQQHALQATIDAAVQAALDDAHRRADALMADAEARHAARCAETDGQVADAQAAAEAFRDQATASRAELDAAQLELAGVRAEAAKLREFITKMAAVKDEAGL